MVTGLALGALLLAGCGALAHEEASEEEPAGPTLKLGTGEQLFEPVAQDDGVPLVPGVQGGHHLWLSMRTRGMVGPRMRMELDLLTPAGAHDAHSDVRIFFSELDTPEGESPAEAEPPYTWEFIGWPAQVGEPAACLEGSPIEIRVRLEDDSGNVSEAETIVMGSESRLGFHNPCE